MTREVAVVIPVFKGVLDPYEGIALKQCMTVLQDHPIYFVGPAGLQPEYMNEQAVSLNFPPKFFEGIAGYNRLLLSREFYESFLQYRYILIHQLDAFVFRDELNHWCSRGFDYVGAPWIDAHWHASFRIRRSLPLWMRIRHLVMGDKDRSVGNGGFSLRRIGAFLSILARLQGKASEFELNEDMFWSIIAPNYCRAFNIPQQEEALQFSYETAPRECHRRNGGRLPFGCHAWWKYDIEFWRPIFSDHGYAI